MNRHAIGAVALAMTLAAPLAAQDMRSLYVSRALTPDTSLLHVTIQYGVGTLNIQPATKPVLYEAKLLYPADRSSPMATYNAAARTLELGIKDRSFEIPGKDSGGVLRVQLARHVPLDLSLKIGATEATIQLGGLAVRRLALKGGATETTLRFDSANTIPMESMEIKVGAAEFHGRGLANARASTIRVTGAAGQTELWFDGTWSNDVTLDSKVVAGNMSIHVPPDVQVISTARAVLGGVSDGGTASHTAHAAVDSSSDDSDDSSDMSNMADSDSENTTPPASPPPPPPPSHPTARGHAQPPAAPAAPASQPKYTLRISGSATMGSLEILHDAASH